MRAIAFPAVAVVIASTAVAIQIGAPVSNLTSARGLTHGAVGKHKFVDSREHAGVLCEYHDGRLHAVFPTSPRAAGRAVFGNSGQFVQWVAKVQQFSHGHWRNRLQRKSGDATLTSKSLTSLPKRPLSDVNAAGDGPLRVVETIDWFPDPYQANEVPDGSATHVVKHYRSVYGSVPQDSCPANRNPTLKPVAHQRVQELGSVHLDLQGGAIGPFRYAVVKGALPAGLTLDAKTGVVSGQVSDTAEDITTTWNDIKTGSQITTVAVKAGGHEATQRIEWSIKDTAFPMPDYIGTPYERATPVPIPNLASTHKFECTLHKHNGVLTYDDINEQAPKPGRPATWGGDAFTFVYYEKAVSANCMNPVN